MFGPPHPPKHTCHFLLFLISRFFETFVVTSLQHQVAWCRCVLAFSEFWPFYILFIFTSGAQVSSLCTVTLTSHILCERFLQKAAVYVGTRDLCTLVVSTYSLWCGNIWRHVLMWSGSKLNLCQWFNGREQERELGERSPRDTSWNKDTHTDADTLCPFIFVKMHRQGAAGQWPEKRMTVMQTGSRPQRGLLDSSISAANALSLTSKTLCVIKLWYVFIGANSFIWAFVLVVASNGSYFQASLKIISQRYYYYI